ncbi:hypothetical protein B0H19DRAFT_967132, partial [Mycena capillaripes]
MLSPFASSVLPSYQGYLARDRNHIFIYDSFNPVLRLPPELTSEIFLFCLPDSEFNVPNSTTAPLLLCQIFRRWRDIALATPGLW